LTLIAGAACYGFFFRRGAWLSVIGYSVAPAERVLLGEVPYRDFLYNYTPGMLWLNALLMKLFGTSLITINSGLLVFKLLTLIAIFFIARRLVAGWAALIPVALALGWIGHKYVFGVVPAQYSMLFVLIGLASMLEFNRTENAVWLLLGGLWVGFVFIFKYNVGLLLLATGTLAIAIRELSVSTDGRRSVSLAIDVAKKGFFFWAGFCVATGAMIGYLIYSGAFGAMVDHFWHHASAYSEQRSVRLPHPKLLGPVAAAAVVAVTGAILILWKRPRLFQHYLVLLLLLITMVLLFPGRFLWLKISATATVAYLPPVLFVGVLARSAWRLKRSARRPSGRRELWADLGAVIIVMLFALGAYLEVYPRADQYHLVRALPPVFLLLVLILARGRNAFELRLENYLSHPGRGALLCLSVPLVFLITTGIKDCWQPHFDSSFRPVERAELEIERGRGVLVGRKQAEFVESIDRVIRENSSEGDPIFSFAQRGTGFYFLSARRNPTRFVWWRSVGIKEEDRRSVLDMISNGEPRLILLQNSLKDKRIRETVVSNYQLAESVSDIAVYARHKP
jgi:4-amino-4-deoxy-L-arabinose transferase-like glycosyltransferase